MGGGEGQLPQDPAETGLRATLKPFPTQAQGSEFGSRLCAARPGSSPREEPRAWVRAVGPGGPASYQQLLGTGGGGRPMRP